MFSPERYIRWGRDGGFRREIHTFSEDAILVEMALSSSDVIRDARVNFLRGTKTDKLFRRRPRLYI